MTLYNDKGKWIGKPSAAPGALYNPLYDKSKNKTSSTSSTPSTPSKSSSSPTNDSLKISDYEINADYDDHFESLKNKTKKAKKYNPKILKVKGVKLTNKNLPNRPKAPKAPKIKFKKGGIKKKYKDAPAIGNLKKNLK